MTTHSYLKTTGVHTTEHDHSGFVVTDHRKTVQTLRLVYLYSAALAVYDATELSARGILEKKKNVHTHTYTHARAHTHTNTHSHIRSARIPPPPFFSPAF